MRFAIARALFAASPALLLLFHAWFIATAFSVSVVSPPARTTALPPPRYPSRSGRFVPDSPALSSSRAWHRRNSPDLPGSDLDEPAPPTFTTTQPSARPGPAMPSAPAVSPTPVGRRVVRRLPDPDSEAASGASGGRRRAVMTDRDAEGLTLGARPSAQPAALPDSSSMRSSARPDGDDDDDDDDDGDEADTNTAASLTAAPANPALMPASAPASAPASGLERRSLRGDETRTRLAARAPAFVSSLPTRASRADRGAWGLLALPPGSDGISVGDPFYRLANPYGTPTLTHGGAGARGADAAGDGLLRAAATPDSSAGAEAAVAGAGAGATAGAGVAPADGCPDGACDMDWRTRRRMTTFAAATNSATAASTPAPVPVGPSSGVAGTTPALMFPRRSAPLTAARTSGPTPASSTAAAAVGTPATAAVTAPRTAAVSAPPAAAAPVWTAPAPAAVYAVMPTFIAPGAASIGPGAYSAPVLASPPTPALSAPPPRLPPGRNGGGESGTEGYSGTENYSGTEGYSATAGYSAAAETPAAAVGHSAAEGTSAAVGYSAATDYSAAAAPAGAAYWTMSVNEMFDDLAPVTASAADASAPALPRAGGRGYGRARPSAAGTGVPTGVSEALGAAAAGGSCGCEEGRPCTVTARTNAQDAEASSARFRRQLNAWAARRGGLNDPRGRRDGGITVMGETRPAELREPMEAEVSRRRNPLSWLRTRRTAADRTSEPSVARPAAVPSLGAPQPLAPTGSDARDVRVYAAHPNEAHWWDGLASAAGRAGSGLRSSADEAARSVRAGAEDARHWLHDSVERAREWTHRAGSSAANAGGRVERAGAGAARGGADAVGTARRRVVDTFSVDADADASATGSGSRISASRHSGRGRRHSSTRRASSEPVSPAATGAASARAGGGGSDGDDLGRRMRLLHGCCSLDCVEVCSPDVGMYQPEACANMVAACDAAKTYDTEYVGPIGGVVAT